MQIDCHTHAFADKVADKALAQLNAYYQLQIPRGGRVRDLLSAGAQAGLDAAILLVAATKPEQVRPANDWILRLASHSPESLAREFTVPAAPRLIPFGTFHPRDPQWLAEIRRLRAAGIRGIKLHPEFQRLDLADPALQDFFAEIERDFICLIHIGDRRTDASNFSTPTKVAAISRNFPRLRIIAAHMGGYQFWEEAYEVLAGRDLYLDTASTFPYLDPDLFRRLVSRHGTERVLFGSDYPIGSPQADLGILNCIDWLRDTEKEQIRGGNCAALLGLGP